MHERPSVIDAVQRLKGLYLEVPGLQLTADDASKLSGLEHDTCRIVLEALQDAHFSEARAKRGLRRRGVILRVSHAHHHPSLSREAQ
jgi:hypothetical protein